MNLATNAIVYLLEQDIHVTETIRGLCDEKSLTLESFSDHSQLLEAVNSQHPDCVIAASEQECTKALDMLEHFQNKEIATPVIILGNHNDVHTAVAVIKAGAVDYIEKPVVYGRLAEHLSQIGQKTAVLSA